MRAHSETGGFSNDLAPSSPKIDCKQDAHNRKNRTEFIDVPRRLSCISCQWCEDALDVQIVAGVQQGSRPKAPRFQTKPRKYKGDGNHHHREAGHGVPSRSARVVVGKDENRIMPQRPDDTADQGGASESHIFREFGDQESSPANLLAERTRNTTHHAETASQQHINDYRDW